MFISYLSYLFFFAARCLINMVYLTACALSGHDDVALLNDVASDAESTKKMENYVIIASLKSEAMGKLINTSFDIKFTRLGF